VLTPVLERIRRGDFDNPQTKPKEKTIQLPYLLMATAMVAVVVVALVAHISSLRQVAISEAFVETIDYAEIPSTNIPLAGAALLEQLAPQIAPGHESALGGNVRNIELAIADRVDGRLYGVATMGDNDVFWFDVLPDGSYRAVAMLPTTETQSFHGIEIGTIVVADGKAQLVLSEGLENFWEGVDIQICLGS